MAVQVLLLLALCIPIAAKISYAVPPSAPEDLVVERTYDGRIVYSWAKPRWPNGILQNYDITLVQRGERVEWSVPALKSYFKYEANKEILLKGRPPIRKTLQVRAVNEHGEGHAARRSFFVEGLNCTIGAAIDSIDNQNVDISVMAPKYCCYGYDNFCIEPTFEVFVTDEKNESSARYRKIDYADKWFNSQLRKIRLSTDDFKKSGTFWVKVVVIDYPSGVWDSSQRQQVVIKRP